MLIAIAEKPMDPVSMAHLAVIGNLTKGLVRGLNVKGEPFDPCKGPEHLVAGFPAMVAGQYRINRQESESQAHVAQFNYLGKVFVREEDRPSAHEIESARETAHELAYNRPPNPVDRAVFNDDDFKDFNKNFPKVAKATTNSESGKMSTDPAKFGQQLDEFADAIERQGWTLWGKQACRALWDLLPSPFKKVSATTKCYQLMQKEKFTKENLRTPTGQLPGMIDTLKAHFGIGCNRPGLGLAAAQDYFQGASETSSAFADRIFLA